MSVILEDLNRVDLVTGSHDIFVLTKGADSIIIPRLCSENSMNLRETEKFVEAYA